VEKEKLLRLRNFSFLRNNSYPAKQYRLKKYKEKEEEEKPFSSANPIKLQHIHLSVHVYIFITVHYVRERVLLYYFLSIILTNGT